LVESLSQDSWWAQELAALRLGDRRLDQRAQSILASRAQRPSATFYETFQDRYDSKAAYRFIAHPGPQITLARLLQGHVEATVARLAGQEVVLLAQDTTSLNYTGLRQTSGLGDINHQGSRGLFLHALLAWRPDGVPLGLLQAHTWARPQVAPLDPRLRNAKSIDQKESLCWWEALRAAATVARRVPQSTLVTLQDRGGDLFELHDLVQAGPLNLHAVVRAQHDRNLPSHQKLWAFMAEQPLGKGIALRVPRHHGQAARQALVEVRWAQVSILPPAVANKRTWPPLRLWAVWVREPKPPEGIQPLEWMLLTDLPVTNWAQASQIIQWYRRRWGNEEWHRMLKSGCGAERREFTTAQHLERELAFELILAWRLLLLVKLGRAAPDLPAQALFAPDELEVLWANSKKNSIAPCHLA
jgi:Transposase DNA-binding